jgi:hypothetical protein
MERQVMFVLRTNSTRLLLIFSMVCASFVASVAIDPPNASAGIGGKRVAVLMPFAAGGTTGNESPSGHATYSGGGFGWDAHGGASAAVYPRVTTNDGAVSMKVLSTSTSSSGAGSGLNIEVKVDGIVVGRLTYRHLVNMPGSIVTNAVVNPGTRLGDTAPSTQYGSCRGFPCSSSWQVSSVNGIHTHMEFQKACYGPQGLSQSVSASTGIALLSSNYGTTSNTGCDVSELSDVASPATPPQQSAPLRFGVLQTNGHFLVKEGGLGSAWSDQLDNVSAGSIYGNRVGVLQTNGHFLVKEGSLDQPWYDLLDNVAAGTLTENRIGVLQTNGHWLVKEGSLSAPWSDQLDNVVQGSMSGNRIGVLQTNGHFLVKEGSLSASWSDQLDNVAYGTLSGNRIGVLQTNGHFLVKEGGLGASWSDQKDNVQMGYLSGNRIAVLQTNGHLLVKEGSLSAPWVDVLDNVQAAALHGDRIGVLQTNGHFLVKEGSLSAPWSDQLDNVYAGTLPTP